jgi:hypothetical protein
MTPGLLGLLLALFQADPVPSWVGWVGFSGVVALAGLAVQWGKWKAQGEATTQQLTQLTETANRAIPRQEFSDTMHRLEDKMDERFSRIDEKIDALFGAMGAERRQRDRP